MGGLDQFSKAQVQFLKYLVWVLLTFLTVATIANWNALGSLKEALPEKYVMLERYSADQTTADRKVDDLSERTQRNFDKIDSKIDRILERVK